MRKYLDLKLGYNCNNNCVHCVISEQRENSLKLHNRDNRTTEEIFSEILKGKENGCTSIIITGGEPTLRSDFKEIVQFAKENGFYVLLQSNGRLFSNKVFLDSVKNYIDMYMIALHGSTALIHDKIIQSENGFKQVVLALKNLVEIDAKIGVKVVISNYNKDDLFNILKFVYELGIKYVNIAFPHINGNAQKNFELVVPRYNEIKSELIKCIVFAENNSDFFLDFEQVLPCLFENEYKVKYFSDLRFSNNLGFVNQMDEGEMIWTEVRKKSKRKNLKCKSCVYDNFCEGYWKEYIEKYGFEEFNSVKRFPLEFKELLAKLKR